MRELSIEEKAKRYDEILERAKNTIEVNQTIPDIVERVESLFPELKESEDERIRKALIYHYQCDGFLCTNGYRIDYKDIRAWLEKQGEQKPAWSEEDELTKKALINLVEMYYGGCVDKSEKNRLLDWLKSLRPQNRWKPSDEQIEALQKECIAHFNYNLCRLLEQLKKLREE